MATADETAQYGFGTAFLNSNPEVKRLVDRAVAQNWTGQRFEYELRQTQWYRAKTDAQREWSVLLKTQPAEASRVLQEMEGNITRMARTLGVALSGTQLKALRNAAVVNGWSDEELQFKIAGHFDSSDVRTQAGLGAQAYNELRTLAADYGVTFSDKVLMDWSRHIVSGTLNVDGFREYVKRQAAGAYPSIASELDRGLTVDQLFDPYRQVPAQTLGVNPETVDIRDPLYRGVFSYQPQGEQQRRAMTMDEWERTLRKDSRYGYDKTQDAVSTASQLAAAIQRDFGQRG